MHIKRIIQAAHTKLKVHRWIAWLLCAALIGGMVSSALPAQAVNENDIDNIIDDIDSTDDIDSMDDIDSTDDIDSEDAYCKHHPEHTEDCGYVEAVEGQPCQYVCKICTDEPEKISIMAAAEPVAVDAEPEDGLIAYFKFDEAGGRLQDYSGKGVKATLHKVNGRDPIPDSIISDSNELGGYFDETGENANALHLEDNACLELTETKDFNDLTDVTVEMRIKITAREMPDQHWLFYAAPTADPVDNPGDFLGVFIDPNEKINIARTTNNSDIGIGTAEFLSNAGDYQYDTWYTIKAIYKPSTMALYIDGNRVVEKAIPNKTSEYFGVDKTLWFGHSAWPDAHFNGYIDYIKIYNYLNYDGLHDGLIDEEQYIITDRVVDPANTTVNMFDYWITGQLDNDYRPELTLDQVRDGGINKNHLFLFAGSDGAKNDYPYNTNLNSSDNVGSWNSFGYNDHGNHQIYEPFPGIVDSILNNGYPQLAIEGLKKTGMFWNRVDSVWYNANDPAESLDYLFDPSEFDGKAAYPDVTGLFRLDNDGYYYFRSNEAFAELNAGQSTRPKESTEGNHITLYERPWKVAERGQFYPFNDWSDLFYQSDEDATGLAKAHLIHEQSTTDEPLNHYFGMTVETEFQQPANGKFNRGTAEPDPMKFTFSGDDDVWIFIDDVLVCDVGGLHQRIRIEIDFSTGKVNFTGDLADDGYPHPEGSEKQSQELTKFDTYLYDMFEEAGKEGDVEWRDKTFSDNSVHTLKFFYLERGNNESNCSISFNLMEPPTDRIRKTDENGDPLAGAEFALYKAKAESNVGPDEWWHTADEFEVVGEPLTTVTSKGNGYAELTDNKGGPITFTDGFYILKEIRTPDGYRTNPDIVLQFYDNTSTFIVVNKYETGAYASFLSHWTYYKGVNYAAYNQGGGTLTSSGNPILDDELKKGLSIIVPLYKQTDATGSFVRWLPLYGSNTNGWYTIADSYQDKNGGNNEDAFIKDVALAAILQIADTDERTPHWYLNYFEGGEYFDAYMENLPGDATRYENLNVEGSTGSGDLRLVTLFLSGDVLKHWGLSEPGDRDGDYARYQALQEALRKQLGTYTEEGAKNFLDGKTTVPKLLYSDEFSRSNRSVIYIPNEQRELRVRKVGLVESNNPVDSDDSDDPDGSVDTDDTDDADDTEVEYVNGAVFAIFNTWQDAVNYKTKQTTATGVMNELSTMRSTVLSYGMTSTIAPETSPEDGWLIFREDASAGNGYAKIDWPSQRSGEGDEADNVLWLKEVFAPDGYALNNNLVRIEVGNIAIYANATGYNSKGEILDDETDDGITVQAYLGKLSQTLVKYALGNHVDVTLQDITITKQTAAKVGENGELLDAADWTDDKSDTYDLHYGMNAHALTSQYGPHDANDPLPVVTTDNGYIRVMPRQNQNVPDDIDHDSGVRKSILTSNGRTDGTPIDLGNLFSLINVVVVEDTPAEPPTEKNPPPEEDPPTEQSSEEETLIYASAKQPPKAEEEPKTTGVLASPNTGDSNMVVLWLTLLVSSTIGIIVVQRRTRKR